MGYLPNGACEERGRLPRIGRYHSTETSKEGPGMSLVSFWIWLLKLTPELTFYK